MFRPDWKCNTKCVFVSHFSCSFFFTATNWNRKTQHGNKDAVNGLAWHYNKIDSIEFRFELFVCVFRFCVCRFIQLQFNQRKLFIYSRPIIGFQNRPILHALDAFCAHFKSTTFDSHLHPFLDEIDLHLLCAKTDCFLCGSQIHRCIAGRCRWTSIAPVGLFCGFLFSIRISYKLVLIKANDWFSIRMFRHAGNFPRLHFAQSKLV